MLKTPRDDSTTTYSKRKALSDVIVACKKYIFKETGAMMFAGVALQKKKNTEQTGVVLNNEETKKAFFHFISLVLPNFN